MGEHSKRKHSDFAASSSHRWMHCPGSVELVKKAPPQEFENKWALEGTKAHECLEYLVQRYSNLAKAVEQAQEKWPLDMVKHCEASAKIIFKLKPSKTAELIYETRVTLSTISKKLFGTIDYAWIDQWGTLVVIDFKYGSGVPVLPYDEETDELNPQLMYYALGICTKYKFEFARVKLAIVQPRVWREDEDPLTEHIATIKQVREFETKVKQAVAAAARPDAPLKATTEGCRWCLAAPMCPEISKAKMEDAGIAFDVETGIEKLPDIEALNSKTLPKVLEACALLKIWIKKTEAHALRVASQGEKIDGFKLVQKRSIRQWIQDAEKKALKLFGKEVYKTEFLSPAQLEKKFGKSAKDFTTDYTSNVSSGYSLVTQKDKRPEVTDIVSFDLEDEGEDF